VRLKGGDPFVWAGGEEAQALAAAGCGLRSFRGYVGARGAGLRGHPGDASHHTAQLTIFTARGSDEDREFAGVFRQLRDDAGNESDAHGVERMA